MKTLILALIFSSAITAAAPLPPVAPDLHPVAPVGIDVPDQCFCIGGVIPTISCQELEIVCE
jgi:hypothetical protein